MSIDSQIKSMLEKKKWAVIGVTPNKEKFGYKIWKVLLNNGYETFAINPKYNEIEGIKCYPSLKDLPVKPEVIDFVVPPKITLAAVEEAKELGIENLWFQPGSWNEEVLEKADSLGLIHVENCVYAILA
ncbi:MAG TPA: CoA-binding protein [Eubacteriaceae bacterium]|jgi:predicted CoA-binding protein|nr:CoA-binding protein [Eubacteriaceae bacterium]